MHVSEIGLLAASDAAIAARVEAEGEVLVTKVEDFVTSRLPDRFGLLWLRIEALLEEGERFVEVR